MMAGNAHLPKGLHRQTQDIQLSLLLWIDAIVGKTTINHIL
ncbi:MAG: hypothetical protein HNEKOMLI_00426 [Sodalis sp. Psp]|nr:hypothetical protein [Sodalis sp. Psp]MCR3756903.1 hypothetical protein [Sodalis sp. Ppy]